MNVVKIIEMFSTNLRTIVVQTLGHLHKMNNKTALNKYILVIKEGGPPPLRTAYFFYSLHTTCNLALRTAYRLTTKSTLFGVSI